MTVCERCAMELPTLKPEDYQRAIAEYEKDNPGMKFEVDDAALICDACYQDYKRWQSTNDSWVPKFLENEK